MRGSGTVTVDRGVPYGHGKLLDVYRPAAGNAGPGPTVLLWHGVGPDERDVLAPLAMAVAGRGVTVVVPDWRSDAPDKGRAHLLTSLAFTRSGARTLGGLDADSIVLAGWSRGGRSAAAVTVRPAAVDGWRPAAVVCLGAGYKRKMPVTGGSPLADLARCTAAPVPFWLVHGTADDIVPVSAARQWAAALSAKGWPVRLAEVATDHGGVIGTEWDAVARRSVPATSAHAIQAGELSARAIIEAAESGRFPRRASGSAASLWLLPRRRACAGAARDRYRD